MSAPTICDEGITDYRIGPDGLAATRSWTVIGTSPDEALRTLDAGTDPHVTQGALFRDNQGASPDLYCFLQYFDVAPVVHPSGTTPGSPNPGMFRIAAYYSRAHSRAFMPQAMTYGEPVAWVETQECDERMDIAFNPGNGKWDIKATNVNEEPLDPPIMRPVGRKTYCLQWIMFATTQPQLELYYRQFEFRTNAAEFLGAPPGCLLCRPVEIVDSGLQVPTEVQTQGKKSWRVTARFAYAAVKKLYVATSYNSWTQTEYPGWYEVRPNFGRRFFTGALVSESRQYADNWQGQTYDDPIPLAPDGTRPLAATLGTYAVVAFCRFESANFQTMLDSIPKPP